MAKNYIKGSIREVEIKGTDDTKLLVSLSLEDFTKIVNEKGFVNIVIQRRRDADQYGNTHYAYENDYKPGEKKSFTPADRAVSSPKPSKLKPPTYKEDLDDNPFI